MEYTVLVVDDEEAQRRALIEKVDWQSAGFRVIGDAENGIDALELAEQLEPDLVITDIKMPLMTGLELAAKIRELRPATHMVILSGYDNFEYAQAAIRYNIISYLLKPVSASELNAELFRIKERLDIRFEEIRGSRTTVDAARRLQLTQFLLPLLLSSGEDAPNEEFINRRAVELGIISPGENARFAVLVTKFKNKENSAATGESHIEFVNAIIGKYRKTESFFVNGRIVSLLRADEENFIEEMQLPLKELVQSASRVLSERCTVGISRPVDSLAQCGGACFQAVTARRYTSDGAGDIRYIGDQEPGSGGEFEYVEKSVFALEQLLKVGDKEQLEKFLEQLYELSSRQGLDFLVIQILATVYRTVNAVSEQALSELISYNPVYSKAAFYDNEPNVRSDIKNLCVGAWEIISRCRKRNTEVLCDRAMEIIGAEYGDESLSLTGVSSRLGVSPNYLSALIKKTKKKNFSTLVTERRMHAAYDMLVCTPAKILEIALKCGYSDQHYFSYCYKKYYGVSPNRTREESRGADSE